MLRRRQAITSAYALVAAAATACGRAPAAALPPAGDLSLGQQAAADLDYLARTIREAHPALVERPAQAALAALARELRGRALDIAEPDALFPLAAQLATSLHDAHTAVSLPATSRVLPYRFRWVSDGLVVAGVETSPVGAGRPVAPLRAGDRVTRLGERTPDELLPALRQLISAENEHWVKARGAALLRTGVGLKALGLVGQDGTTTLSVTSGSGADGAVQAIPVCAELPPGGAAVPAAREWFGWRLDRDAGLGVFWLDSCQDTPKYRRAVDDFFAAVYAAQLPRVAIDVRENTGGNSSAIDALLKYLPADALRAFSGQVRTSRPAREQGRGQWWDPIVHTAARYFPLQPARPEDRSLTFHGQVYVLTSWLTFSSGNWVAALLQDNRLATVVGEPTGNAPSSFGDALRFTTPYLGLRFSVSYKRWQRPAAERDPADTLAPDVHVPTTAADVRDGRDPQIEWLRCQAAPAAR
jgi:hypothetical protein